MPDLTHPMRETLTRVSLLDSNNAAAIGTLDEGWIRAREFTLKDSPVLNQALAHQALQYPHMDARTRGAYLIGEYSWYVPMAAISAYLTEHRVPDLSPDNVALRFSTYTWHHEGASGEAERIEVRFLTGRFAALPNDPDATHTDAVIVPDEDALRERLRASLEAHFTPLIERIQAVTRLGHHAQWCLVADACAALFLFQGQTLKDETRGRAEGLAFVKADGSHMKNPGTDYVSLHYLDHSETFRLRGGCCRFYTVSEAGDKCSTCVLHKPEDRNRLLLDYMTRKYAQGMQQDS